MDAVVENPNHRVKLPSAVQKQSDDAEQRLTDLQQQIIQAREQQYEGRPLTEDLDAPAQNIAPATPEPAATEPPAQDPLMQEQPPPQQPQTGTVSQDEYEKVKHQLSVMTGKYNAEVPRMAHEIRELKADLAAAQRTQALNHQTFESGGSSPYVTDKDVDEFGEDQIDLATRVARGTIEQTLAPVNQRMEQNEKLLFRATLTALSPDWVGINTSEDFVNWLSEVDGYSGKKRHDMLDEAYLNRDAEHCAWFFNEYKKVKAAAPPTSQNSAPVTPLEQQVVPSATPYQTPPQQQRVSVYPVEEIPKFYTDVAKGYYKGREAEKRAIEKRIEAASVAGRVR